jgi:hypothetical protein
MNRLYTLTFSTFFLLIFNSCSKDVLKSYERRIIGTWQIKDIDGFGIGSSANLPFSEGDLFSFSQDGKLSCTSSSRTYSGSWDIRRQFNEEETKQSLQITAIDFNSQDVKTEYFNDLAFTTTNRFKGFINNGTKTYIYHFVRE